MPTTTKHTTPVVTVSGALGALGAAAALLLSGCGTSASSTVSNDPALAQAAAAVGGPASTGNVEISNYKFGSGAITVKVGATVTWTNKDQFDHSVVEDDMAFTGTPIHTGASYTHTYDKPGAYSYHCGIHNFMTAKVTVTS